MSKCCERSVTLVGRIEGNRAAPEYHLTVSPCRAGAQAGGRWKLVADRWDQEHSINRRYLTAVPGACSATLGSPAGSVVHVCGRPEVRLNVCSRYTPPHGQRIEESHLRRACRERGDRGDQVHRLRRDWIERDALRGDPLRRRYRKPVALALGTEEGGKEVYFWSFVVAILIFAVGAGVSLYEGIKHLLHPNPVENVLVNYVVLAIAVVFEGAAWWFALRGFRAAKGERGYFEAVRAGKDPTLFVVLLEDSAALLGLTVAFFGIGLGQLTGNPYFDGGASIIIGLILGAVACLLAWETKGLLIGEAADPEIQHRIREIISVHSGVKRVNELITMHMGPQSILVNISLDFADGLSSNAVEEAVAELNVRIKQAVPDVHRVFIEAESWTAHRAQRQEQR